MSTPSSPPPLDPQILLRMIALLVEKNARLEGEVVAYRRLVFGPRSERTATLLPGQESLDLGDGTVAAPDSANDNQDATVTGGSGRRPARRNVGALPKDLPRIERVIEPEATACPCCGGGLHRIGEDVSEALDIVPAIVRVLQTVRPKYGCRACEGRIVRAPAPARVVTGGMVSTALVAHAVTARYAWHLPLYRQRQMLAGQGIRLDRATLAHWIRRAAWWLRPLYERLLGHIRSRPVVFYDETPLPRLDPGCGRTKTCQLWACAVDERPWQGPSAPAVAYVYAEGRQTAEVERQLSRFSGILQVHGSGLQIAGQGRPSRRPDPVGHQHGARASEIRGCLQHDQVKNCAGVIAGIAERYDVIRATAHEHIAEAVIQLYRHTYNRLLYGASRCQAS